MGFVSIANPSKTSRFFAYKIIRIPPCSPVFTGVERVPENRVRAYARTLFSGFFLLFLDLLKIYLEDFFVFICPSEICYTNFTMLIWCIPMLDKTPFYFRMLYGK